MSVTAGTRLGPYEITSLIGAGGMGEVYAARDTRLDRTVAVKVLSNALAADQQFQDRFEREARSISALNHPNICTLYDVGRHDGRSFLVMEHLDGETLAERLAHGALPVAEALRIAGEIAGALDAAHRRGIVHRDVKPGNIMLAKAGTSRRDPPQAKLLDFGLAKTAAAGAVAEITPTAMATGTAPLTARGTVLGTYQYMAPEQVEGEPADARTDIFALGVVLYEMVTGRKAFTGRSQASLMSSILKDEPPPVTQVQAVAPPALDHVVRRCLAKSPDDRYQSVHDVLIELRWIAEGGSGVSGTPEPARTHRRGGYGMVAAAVVGLAAVVAGAIWLTRDREDAPAAELVEFAVTAPESAMFTSALHFELSPDGRHLVFVASVKDVPMLWLRPLGTTVAHPIPGTEGATFPFWSPDNQSLAFFADGKLKRLQLAGGPVVTVSEEPTARGGTWNRNNVIVVGTANGTLRRLSAAGGAASGVTTLQRGDISHLLPSFLPDGDHVLFVSVNNDTTNELRVTNIVTGETTSVGPTQAQGAYASGHVLIPRGAGLVAQRFDPVDGLSGNPVTVVDALRRVAPNRGLYSVSGSGMLAYVRGGAPLPAGQLTWIHRSGKVLATIGDPSGFVNVGLSPDEERVAVAMTPGPTGRGGGGNRDIWMFDLASGGTASRLTIDPAAEGDPIWSPDGRTIIFNSARTSGSWSLFRRPANPNGQDELVLDVGVNISAPDWSSDGQFVAFTRTEIQTRADLWVLPLGGDRKPQSIRQTPFNEDDAAFSPDGRRIAYNSDASGRNEVYVQAFPAAAEQIRVSRNGGWSPRWRSDGRELFFLALDGGMVAAEIRQTPNGLTALEPRLLFQSSLLPSAAHHRYAVAKDGSRFLYAVPGPPLPAPTSFNVVLNWPAMIRE